MKLTKNTKTMIAAIALAGAAGTIGVAFTSTGVTTTGQAALPQFVGGTVRQDVDGATLEGIVYAFTDETNTAVTSVTLTFVDNLTDGKIPTIALSGGAGGAYTCTAVEVVTFESLCTTLGAEYVGLTEIAVTVPGTNNVVI
jgi:hypothetical protein